MREIIRQKIVDGVTTQPPWYTRRDIRIPRVPGKAYAVIGMRRTGKTTFLWQILDEKLKKGVPRESLVYFSFEDERLADIKVSDLYLIVEEYYNLYPEWRDKEVVTFFFDEIQVVSDWELFLRRVLDTELVDLFISGSSAKLLSREIASSMRGRAMEIVVYPFSFREYLRHSGHERTESLDRAPKAVRSIIEKDLRDYLLKGGFPETLGLDHQDRTELLQNYVDVVLLRDVIERHGVTQPVVLRWLLRQLLRNSASFFSIHKFYNDLRSQGFRVSKDTLHSYLSYLQDAFLIDVIEIAAYSGRKQMVNPRKVYPIDMGLIPIFDVTGKKNIGHALETAVFRELKRRKAKINYVRVPRSLEVDFLAIYPDRRSKLIQVCADVSEQAVLKRELRSLLKAHESYPEASLNLITLTVPPKIDVPSSVHVHAASTWLLSSKY